MDNKALVQLMYDAAKGNTVGTKFSKEEISDALRKELFELMGTDKIDYKVMREHGPKVFALVEEALDRIIPETVEEQFNEFAEVKAYAFGDKPVFTSDDVNLFKIANISDGNNNLRRQRLWTGRKSFTVDTSWKGVKLYEEFMRFLTGRISWPETVAKVAESYAQDIRLDVYNTFVNTYTTVDALYKQSGTPTVDNVAALIARVEAATNRSAEIVGTKLALAKIPAAVQTPNMGDTINSLGYIGSFQGTPMRVLKQGYKLDSTDWALDDKKLLILPSVGIKPVKIYLEGESIVDEKTALESADYTMEYTFMKKTGIGVIQTYQYGIFDIA